MVIGAGIAGLAIAIRQRVAGHEVDVVEANPYTGGKRHAFGEKGYRFDAGPSLFTMPQWVDELFELAGENPRDYFNYTRVEKVCHYFWPDGEQFVVSADRKQFISEAGTFFNESEKKINQYLVRNEKKYVSTSPLFIQKSLHKVSTYLSMDTVKGVLAIPYLNLFDSLHEVNQKAFTNPKLIQLFDRFATYNGSSPYKTPGIMSMIPHLEMDLGTYFPKGGMHSISQSLYQLALRLGVKVQLSCKALKIEQAHGKATGVHTTTGFLKASTVVSNMDIFSTYKTLLSDAPSPEKILKQERSSSGLIFYWGIKKKFPNLGLHNIFFSQDYKKEFTQLFDEKTMPSDPTIYINISSKEEKSDAPLDCENWFVMVNAPSNLGQNWDQAISQTREVVLKKLSHLLGENVESLIECESILDPIQIENRTSSHQGSLYGTSSNSRYAAFNRHPNFSNHLSNVYFCGGSVHPGGGIPLCLQSARITSELMSSS